MTYETLQYVDANGVMQEVAFQQLSANGSANGSAIKAELLPRTHDISEFRITLPQPPEVAMPIPFKSRCVVWACRTSASGANNTFGGGQMLFQGRRTNREKGDVSGTRVSSLIVISDAMWDLKHITYQASWNIIAAGSISNPVYAGYFWPDVVLFQSEDATLNPPPLNNTITTWQQMQAVISYAQNFATGNDALQLMLNAAPEFTPSYCNWQTIRSQKCLQALQLCLRPHPGVYWQIDHTTTPPTLHLRDRAHMTPVTLPYASTLADGTVHIASDIEALWELVPDRVALYYKKNSTVNGQPVVGFNSDVWPVGKGPSLMSDDYSIDITGSATQVTSVNFVSTAFDPTSLDLWRLKMPTLQQISAGGQVPDDGSLGALEFLDDTINGDLSVHPKGIQVLDEAGNPIDLSLYQYYTDDDVYAWFQLPGGGAASVVKAVVTAFFSYRKNSTIGGVAITPSQTEHSHSIRLKLTTAPTAEYVLKQLLNPGEFEPPNLAQNIWTELANPDINGQPRPQYRLRHEILQVAADANSVPLLVLPGLHVVNLSGGNPAWLAIEAVPQDVTITFQRTGEGRLFAQHSIACGPVEFLEPAYRTALANMFMNRKLLNIDPNQRLNGMTSSNAVDLSSEAARENSVPADPVAAVSQNVFLDGAGNFFGVKNSPQDAAFNDGLN